MASKWLKGSIQNEADTRNSGGNEVRSYYSGFQNVNPSQRVLSIRDKDEQAVEQGRPFSRASSEVKPPNYQPFSQQRDHERIYRYEQGSRSSNHRPADLMSNNPLLNDSMKESKQRNISPKSSRIRVQDDLQLETGRTGMLSIPDEDRIPTQRKNEGLRQVPQKIYRSKDEVSKDRRDFQPSVSSNMKTTLDQNNPFKKSKEIEPSNNPVLSEIAMSTIMTKAGNTTKNPKSAMIDLGNISANLTKVHHPKETLTEILKVKSDFIKTNLHQTPDYIDNEDHRKQIMTVFQDIFRPKDSKQRTENQKLYGLGPEEWKFSPLNPFLKESQRRQQNQSDSSDDEERQIMCITTRKNDSGERVCSFDIVISEDNPFYLFFNFIVSVLCIISSYFYLYLAAFRYPVLDEDPASIFWIWISFESTFLLHMLLQFILEYRIEDKNETIKNVLDIAVNYLQTQFIFDFVPLLPFQLLDLERKRARLFYLIKMIRLAKGFSLFDVPKMMGVIKQVFQKNLQYIVENDKELANDRDIDNNNIEQILIISYVLKIFKLVVVILNITYLIGMGWFILCEAIADFNLGIDNLEDEQFSENDIFIYKFEIQGNDHTTNIVLLMYFAFTSLSTVGFGDFHPRSNVERLTGAFILLFGVAIFSYIMGNFIEILQEFKKFHEDLDDGDNLTKFFGTLKKFNNQMHIKLDLKKKIENHFEYQWKTDKNMAFRDDADINIFEQLPEEVRSCIYKDFLFLDFLHSFKKQFTFPKRYNRFQPSFYTWDDQAYVNFMLDLLRFLEPRREEKFEILIQELDEFNEVIFFQEGTIEVGFEINRMRTYVLRYKDKCVIGAYGVTFNKRSLLVYRTASVCMGYSIRRTNWKQVVNDHPEISNLLKEQVKLDYEQNILSRVLQRKNTMLKKWSQRSDYNGILQVVPKDFRQSASITVPPEEMKEGDGTPRLPPIEIEDTDFTEQLEDIEERLGSQKKDVLRVYKQYDHLYFDHVDLVEAYGELNEKYLGLNQNHSRLEQDHDAVLTENEMLRRELKKLSPNNPILAYNQEHVQVSVRSQEEGQEDEQDFVVSHQAKVGATNSLQRPRTLKNIS